MNPKRNDNGNRRYRVCAPIERDGRDKPFWPRLGTAFENPGKEGKPPTITVKLDSHPMGDTLVLFEDEGREPGSEG
jgi:hypothetical protein